MRSMTGYGSGRAKLGEGELVIDLRAVNHRFLDVRVRLPSRLQGRTPVVEKVIRQRLERGRVDVTSRLEGQTLPQPSLDLERARGAFDALKQLRDELSPEQSIPLSLLASVPDLFATPRTIDDEALDAALTEAAANACNAVLAMRQSEGTALKAEFGVRLGDLEVTLEKLTRALPQMIETRRLRLRERLDALLENVEVELQPSRLEQEIAVLADRSDVAEELARLDSHRGQMLELLEDSRQAIGKRMDFLLQEMSREANTIGSKVQETEVTSLVIALKTAVEQMREQAQNVL